MHPAFLVINKIVCIQTEDLIESDDLYGVLGDSLLSLGQFNDNQERVDYPEIIIPDGVLELTLAEHDVADSDDVLGVIDLTQDMDMDREFGILEGRARYNVYFFVAGEPDEQLVDRCPEACPTCGGACLRKNHDGQVHWCGRHEWGAN
ncbi:hypothetical protein HFK74_19495|uniref:hypothetical protein n=1 Tax=Pseudomonas sp. SbOxS1 TaxID=2723884 RepID=UPI0015D44013|nr:hypothetical protein [Pseudomonas sp. SbOxS1]NYU04882.1 hypothetical protein [Pseudomonas sp. SbOxS1]